MRLSGTSLGEAATAAKSRITDLETRRTWLLFGDPTLFGVPTAVTPPPMDGGTDGDAMEAERPRRAWRAVWIWAPRWTAARPMLG